MTHDFAVKVHELVDNGNVRIIGPAAAWVHGSHDWYRVEATPEGVLCTCRAATYQRHREGPCAHASAAMVAWATLQETPFG